MPIHEYVLPDGSRVERLFMHGEPVPEEITVETNDDNGDPVTWTGRKTVSRTVVKFKTPMSGGTTSRDLIHKDDGSVVEPGRLNDVKRRRQEIEHKRKQARQSALEKSLADYSL